MPYDAVVPEGAHTEAPVTVPKRVTHVKYWKIGAIALCVLLIAAGVTLWTRARGVAVTTVAVSRMNIDHRIIASGRVLAPSVITVSSVAAGRVLSVGAALGQHVNVGDSLVQIDDSEARAALLQETASVEQARARAAQNRLVAAVVTNEALNQAQTNLEKAKANLERATLLASTGSVTRVELETAQQGLEVAQAAKASALAQQAATAPLGADSRVASSAILQAEAQRKAAEVRVRDTRIVASTAGTILSRLVEPGDVVLPARALLTIATDADVLLTFNADERNLSYVALGQKAIASTDAFPEEKFASEVVYVAPSIDAQRGTVEVRLRVLVPPPYLRPEMTVSIDLLVRSKADALVVASDVVHGSATPSPWVIAVVDGKAVRKDVVLGIVGEGSTEVLRGVSEADELVVPERRVLALGSRVRPKKTGPKR
jgi:HlyD family secretion protein